MMDDEERRQQIRRDAEHRSVSSSDTLWLLDALERVERREIQRDETIAEWMTSYHALDHELMAVVAERDALRAALRDYVDGVNTYLNHELDATWELHPIVERVNALLAAAGSSQEHQHD